MSLAIFISAVYYVFIMCLFFCLLFWWYIYGFILLYAQFAMDNSQWTIDNAQFTMDN